MAVDAGRAGAALALLLNAFVWGVSWWPLRTLQAHGLHPLWSTAAIYIACLAVLAIARPGAWRGLRGNPQLWLLMAAAGATNVCFNWAVTVGDVVRVVLLFYLMPAWSAVLAWPLLGERPGIGALVRLVMALAGVAVILHTPGAPWPLPQDGIDALALLGGFSFALTNILLRRLHATPADTRIGTMFTGGTVAAVGAALVGMTQGVVSAPVGLPPVALAIAAGLGLAFLAGNAALQYGAARLAAQTTALVMLSEVLFASASSVLLDAATLGPRTWVGGALVVAAAAWSALAGPGEAARPAPQSAA